MRKGWFAFIGIRGVRVLTIPLVFLGIHLYSPPLQAQSLCQGTVCNNIQEGELTYGLMIYSLQEQYLSEIIKDMTRAQTLANLTGVPTGTVTLDRTVSVGISGTGTYTPLHRINSVYVPGVGLFPALPVAGVGFVPRARFGFNLGRMMGMEYDPRTGWFEVQDVIEIVDKLSGKKRKMTRLPGKPGPLSPLRFDIYGNLFSYTYNYRPSFDYNPLRLDWNFQNRGKFQVKSEGAMVRYHALEQRRMAGPLLVFQGLAVAVGYQRSVTTFKYLQGSGSMADMTLQVLGNRVIWDGVNYANFNMDVMSVPLEVQSGIQFLSSYNVTGSAGVSFNHGAGKLTVLRTGNIYLESDLATQISRYLNGDPGPYSLEQGLLSMRMEAKKNAPPVTFYLKQGSEINIFYVKISTEFIYASDGTTGFTIGARVEI